MEVSSLPSEALVALLFRPSIGDACMSRLISDIMQPKIFCQPMGPVIFTSSDQSSSSEPIDLSASFTNRSMKEDEDEDEEIHVDPVTPDEDEERNEQKEFKIVSQKSEISLSS